MNARTKSLVMKLQALATELATCTTAAQVRCIKETIADTERQLDDTRK